MRDDLDGLLKDSTLVNLAFGLAIGWSLYQLAHGVATFVDGFLAHVPSNTYPGGSFPGAALTWIVGNRVVSLDQAFIGLVELGLVIAAAVLVQRQRAPKHR